jgi:hypothetical protein
MGRPRATGAAPRFGAALGLIVALAVSAPALAADPVRIDGQRFTPSPAECVAALSAGQVIAPRQSDDRSATVFVFYDGAIYTIITNINGLICYGARMSL